MANPMSVTDPLAVGPPPPYAPFPREYRDSVLLRPPRPVDAGPITLDKFLFRADCELEGFLKIGMLKYVKAEHFAALGKPAELFGRGEHIYIHWPGYEPIMRPITPRNGATELQRAHVIQCLVETLTDLFHNYEPIEIGGQLVNPENRFWHPGLNPRGVKLGECSLDGLIRVGEDAWAPAIFPVTKPPTLGDRDPPLPKASALRMGIRINKCI